jgi:hypothetical protein
MKPHKMVTMLEGGGKEEQEGEAEEVGRILSLSNFLLNLVKSFTNTCM